MTILITGINGQLGKALITSNIKNNDFIGLNKKQFNLEDFNDCKDLILNIKPKWIINTAAYTDVNNAEIEEEKAYRINCFGVENIAKTVSNYGGKILHISTDFVFDGTNAIGYKPADRCNPLNVYGSSKYAGEKLIMKYPNVLVLRTSWLYGPTGSNFCLTILNKCKLLAKEKRPLEVVSDQISCPTSSINLAQICWKFINLFNDKDFSSEIFHWSNSGVASWYDFAKSIIELGLEFNLISNKVKVLPIKAKQYKSKTKRPNFSLLDCEKTKNLLKTDQIYWKDSLKEIIKLIEMDDL